MMITYNRPSRTYTISVTEDEIPQNAQIWAAVRLIWLRDSVTFFPILPVTNTPPAPPPPAGLTDPAQPLLG